MNFFLYGLKVKDESEFTYVKQILDFCKSESIHVAFYKPYAKELTKKGFVLSNFQIIDSHLELLEFKPDITITLGGDGTILHATTLIKDSNIPILGINLGRLGFLASVEKKMIAKALNQILLKKYTTDQRSLLSLKSNLSLFPDFPFALNDFTLHKRDNSSMINIHAYVDDQLLNIYWADGVIVSTPTGSTGYSLSCGGPIVFPDSSNFIITPVAPHNLNVRPLVISDSHKISLRVEGRSDNFMCTLDGRYETITSMHEIELVKADFNISLISLQGNNFMKTMSEKLWWGLDKRN